MQNWDSKLYDNKHSFVTEYGNDVLQLLEPRSGELILDLGCGTGVLTNKIANSGAKVIGIDASQSMIDEATRNYPATEFICADGHNFNLGKNKFDAVFSNAALHWMMNPDQVISSVNKALKPGGRFVFEMGGHGNVSRLLWAITTAVKQLGLTTHNLLVNYYPDIAEYATLLKNGGIEAASAWLFSRPTLLEGDFGLRNWIKMFRTGVLSEIDSARHDEFFQLVEKLARPYLHQNGGWFADYVRLRMIAKKVK